MRDRSEYENRDLYLEKNTESTEKAGILKFFDRVRGYGFVAVPGESDVFVHVRIVDPFFSERLLEGARVHMRARLGPRGWLATEILRIDPPPDTEDARVARTREDLPTGIVETLASERDASPFLPAAVKWFDRNKGFGFLQLFGCPYDVFVHMETVRKCGLPDLAPLQAVAVSIVQGPRGWIAVSLRTWEASFNRSNEFAAIPDMPICA